MKLINLTPHALNIPGGIVLPPSGTVARVKSTDSFVDELHYNGITVPIITKTFGDVEGLPDPEEGTYLIVSGLVKARCQDRPDVLAPGELERDTDGKVIGLKNFSL